jgi:hypothetical protein
MTYPLWDQRQQCYRCDVQVERLLSNCRYCGLKICDNHMGARNSAEPGTFRNTLNTSILLDRWLSRPTEPEHGRHLPEHGVFWGVPIKRVGYLSQSNQGGKIVCDFCYESYHSYGNVFQQIQTRLQSNRDMMKRIQTTQMGKNWREGDSWTSKKNTECQFCMTPFTATVRRHHCRRCGSLLCSRCCPKQAAIIPGGYFTEKGVFQLGDTGPKKVRICNLCRADLTS